VLIALNVEPGRLGYDINEEEKAANGDEQAKNAENAERLLITGSGKHVLLDSATLRAGGEGGLLKDGRVSSFERRRMPGLARQGIRRRTGIIHVLVAAVLTGNFSWHVAISYAAGIQLGRSGRGPFWCSILRVAVVLPEEVNAPAAKVGAHKKRSKIDLARG